MAKTKISKANKIRAIQLASQLSNLIQDGETRIQSDRVFILFLKAGFCESETTKILRFWEDAISLYNLEFNEEEQIKVICDILEKIEWPKK